MDAGRFHQLEQYLKEADRVEQVGYWKVPGNFFRRITNALAAVILGGWIWILHLAEFLIGLISPRKSESEEPQPRDLRSRVRNLIKKGLLEYALGEEASELLASCGTSARMALLTLNTKPKRERPVDRQRLAEAVNLQMNLALRGVWMPLASKKAPGEEAIQTLRIANSNLEHIKAVIGSEWKSMDPGVSMSLTAILEKQEFPKNTGGLASYHL